MPSIYTHAMAFTLLQRTATTRLRTPASAEAQHTGIKKSDAAFSNASESMAGTVPRPPSEPARALAMAFLALFITSKSSSARVGHFATSQAMAMAVHQVAVRFGMGEAVRRASRFFFTPTLSLTISARASVACHDPSLFCSLRRARYLASTLSLDDNDTDTATLLVAGLALGVGLGFGLGAGLGAGTGGGATGAAGDAAA
mmetsp:Transcript_55391/g.152562  ORF Transcript_55391/g.152562 Transcript_55391/m.152562 type:complete len:200 (-) Transcript_55391:927-1526(-)